MKAIIMAGGEGSRLRPLTCDCPKPMMRLMDRPVMEYALKLLKKHGIREAAVTLGYLPDAIVDFFGDGSEWGLTLRYYTERVPLGTAGGVRQAADFLNETFCVLSGDGVTDLDLTAALKFHRERGALATMVLTRVANPLEYGVVVTGPDGRVRSFQEKPGPGEVISDTINTGIYILEPEILDRVPDGKPCDFGSELFPKLVQEGQKVFGCVLEGYWCDIGDVPAYLRAHFDLLDGKLKLDVPTGVQRGALVDEDARIERPCFVGPGARIARDAHIGAYSVIGSGALVDPQAGVKRSVLWKGARMEKGAQARGCVLAANAAMSEGAHAFEESALGTGASLGARASLMPGVKVWPYKAVQDGERLEANLVWGSRAERGFSEGALSLSDPAAAARAAQALAADLKPKEFLLAHTHSAVSLALFHACAAGLMAQGVQVLDAGASTLPQLRHALKSLGADGAALVDSAFLTPLTKEGALLPRKRQRSIASMLLRQDFSGPFSGITRPMVAVGRTEFPYVASLSRAFRAHSENAPPVAVFAEDMQLLSVAERAFVRCGINVRCEWEEEVMELDGDEVGVWLNATGESAAFVGADGALTEAEGQLLLLWTALESGERTLLLPASFTRAADKLALRYGAELYYESVERSRWMDALARLHPEQFLLHFDGVFFALRALSALMEAGVGLSEWRQQMPKVHRKSRVIEMALNERGRVLRAFSESEANAEFGGGIRLNRERGWAWICPDEKRPLCRIVSESADAEFASELCDFCEKTLKQKLQGK
ncbi:MAG: NTP transferase domain-containing protein [Clostridiales bacterium]|nr:NTP transferase domain-containing protein [Clostridiales bacterium]